MHYDRADHHLSLAKQLAAASHDAGVHPEHGAVIYCHDRIWRVAGGDYVHPSLICLAGVRLADVAWLVIRLREEPVA
jgi:hypothetical protein